MTKTDAPQEQKPAKILPHPLGVLSLLAMASFTLMLLKGLGENIYTGDTGFGVMGPLLIVVGYALLAIPFRLGAKLDRKAGINPYENALMRRLSDGAAFASFGRIPQTATQKTNGRLCVLAILAIAVTTTTIGWRAARPDEIDWAASSQGQFYGEKRGSGRMNHKVWMQIANGTVSWSYQFPDQSGGQCDGSYNPPLPSSSYTVEATVSCRGGLFDSGKYNLEFSYIGWTLRGTGYASQQIALGR